MRTCSPLRALLPIYLLLAACEPAAPPPPAAQPTVTVGPAGPAADPPPAAPVQAPAAAPLPAVALPGEPTVTFALPRGLVEAPPMLAVGFDRPMVALGVLDTPAKIEGFALKPAVALRFQWIGTDTLAAYPEKPLPGATTFQVEVRDFAALDGKRLPAPRTWTFETAPVGLVQSLPEDGATGIAPDPTLVLRFNQPVDLPSLQKALRVEVPAGKAPGLKLELAKGKALQQAAGSLGGQVGDLAGKVVLARLAGKLPQKTQVRLVIGPGVQSLEGPNPSTESQTVQFTTYGPMAVEKAACAGKCRPDDWQPVRITFANRLADKPNEELVKFFSVQPPVPGLHVSCWSEECGLGGQVPLGSGQKLVWKPGQRYTVTVAPGIADVHGQKLAKAHSFSFTVGHRAPTLELLTEGSVLEKAEGPHRIALLVRNAPQIEAKAARIQAKDVADVVAALDRDGWTTDAARPAKKVPLKVPLDLPLKLQGSEKTDEDARRLLDLDAPLGNQPGLLLVDLTAPRTLDDDGRPLQVRKLYQVTDLHVLLKGSADDTVAWVTSYASGQPVAGVQVQVQGPEGKVLWTGTTGADGLARGAGVLPPGNSQEPRVAVASKGGDTAFLALDGTTRQWTGVDSYEWEESPRGRLRGFLFADKNVYKLGESCNVKGIVRGLGPDGLVLPAAGAKVTVTLTDPADKEVHRQQATLSAQGTFDVSTKVPATGRYGGWRVTAEVADRPGEPGEKFDTHFDVLIYRTPKFKSKAQIEGRHFVRGDIVPGNLTASWYTGGPLAGAESRADASGYASSYEPPGWPGFLFGIHTWEDDSPGARNYLSHTTKGQLDAQGRWAFQIPTKLEMDRPLHVNVEATASDPTGQTVTASTAFWLHPAAIAVGLGMPSAVVQAGKPAQVELIAVTPEGKAQAGAPLEAVLLRREWRSVRVQGLGGTLEWQSKRVDTEIGRCKLTSATTAVRCQATPSHPGYHVVVATGKDSAGRISKATTSFYVTGPGTPTWGQGDERGPMLVADKPLYQVGDKARILVKNQVPGARAIVTEERGGVLRQRLVQFAGSAEAIEVPIEGRHVPNVFVSVAIFAGRRTPGVKGGQDTGAPMVDIATLELQVDPGPRRLKVAIQPDAPRHRPQDEVSVKVSVQDADGKGRPAEVTLWAVDEGVLALTGHETPDPFGTFYAGIPHGVDTWAAVAELVRGKVGEDKGEDGGGGGSASVRGEFRDVAFWQAALQAGPDGTLTTKFKLPDNLTTYRLMAVAVDGATGFGNGEAQLQVDKPLMLLPTLPKAVQIGDRFEVALVARNQSGGPLTGTVSLAVTGGVTADGPVSQPLQLGAGESKEVRFQVAAKAPGPATVTLRAQAPGVDDAVRETVEVLDPRPIEHVATYGMSETGVTQAVRKDPQVQPDSGGLKVTVAATGLTGLERSVAYLLEYPYGCTEQVASQLLALLYLDQFSKELKILPEKAGKARELAQVAIEKILAAQHPGQPGAFQLWTDADQPDALATAWALWVLKDAADKGFSLDPQVFKDGGVWLRKQLATPQQPSGSTKVLDAERALVLAALAAVGQPDAGYLQQVFDRRKDLPPSAQLLLAQAALQTPSGKPKAEQILDELTRALHVDAATAHLQEPDDPRFWALWPSPVRTNALLVDLMARLQPSHPLAVKVARWLVEQKDQGHFGSTQDNAWALRGLGRWFATAEGTAPKFGWQVLLGERPVGQGRVEGRSTATASVAVAQKDLPPGQVPVRIAKDGPGLLHYAVDYSYSLPIEALRARNAGLLVRRTVLGEKGEVDPKTLRRGEHVLVTLTVVADADRPYVVVVDTLPAGLEPADFRLNTANPAMLEQLRKVQARGFGLKGPAAWAAGNGAEQNLLLPAPVSHQEFAKREVRFFVDRLPQGPSTLTYVARAAIRGEYLGLGARAEMMYRPEVFGASAPARLRVE